MGEGAADCDWAEAGRTGSREASSTVAFIASSFSCLRETAFARPAYLGLRLDRQVLSVLKLASFETYHQHHACRRPSSARRPTLDRSTHLPPTIRRPRKARQRPVGTPIRGRSSRKTVRPRIRSEIRLSRCGFKRSWNQPPPRPHDCDCWREPDPIASRVFEGGAGRDRGCSLEWPVHAGAACRPGCRCRGGLGDRSNGVTLG